MADVLQIFPSYAVDTTKWNNCIRQSGNGLIYATAGYLNAVADNWSGIVVNDYAMVMPLPWRKKLGIQYYYDVPFIQQLGWFGKEHSLNKDDIFKTLFGFCSYGDYTFNYTNEAVKNHPGIKQCNNYTLDLSAGYDTIRESYSADLLNNIKKSNKQNCIYRDGDMEEAVSLYQSLYQERMAHVKESDFVNFKNLCTVMAAKRQVIVKQVCATNNKLLAVAVLLEDENRLYNIMNSITPAGRKTGSNHFLFDNIIKEFSGQNLLLDFEGSDIAGIEHFYQNFGPVNQPYYRLHFNNLAAPLKLFKR